MSMGAVVAGVEAVGAVEGVMDGEGVLLPISSTLTVAACAINEGVRSVSPGHP